MPSSYRIHFGLAEVAYRKRDTNAALRNYRMYLSNAPTNTPESKEVFARMKELKPGYP
jgi:hypothetical protein